MRNLYRSMLFSLLACLLVVSSARAQNRDQFSDVMEVLKPKVANVLSVLQNPDISKEEKRVKIDRIVDPLFHYSLMAKLVLGRQHWPGLSEDQRNRFIRMFTRVLKSSYFQKMNEVSEVDVRYGDPVQKGENKVYVPTVVQFQDKDVDVEYRMFRAEKDDPWKIFDVVIKGVSIVKSYHSQYSDYLEDHSFEQLLEKLDEKMDELKSDRDRDG